MKKIVFILVAALTIVTISCGQSIKNKSSRNNTTVAKKAEVKKAQVLELTSTEFKNRVMDFEKNPKQWIFKGDKPAIIDFYATWCGPCKATAPIVENLAEEYNGKIDFYKIDIDAQPELASLFDVSSIPSILFIPKTGKPKMSVGAMSKPEFENTIKSELLK